MSEQAPPPNSTMPAAPAQAGKLEMLEVTAVEKRLIAALRRFKRMHSDAGCLLNVQHGWSRTPPAYDGDGIARLSFTSIIASDWFEFLDDKGNTAKDQACFVLADEDFAESVAMTIEAAGVKLNELAKKSQGKKAQL